MGFNKLSNDLLKAAKKKKKKTMTAKEDRDDGPEKLAEAAHFGVGGRRKGKLITDPRFAAVHSDPRFQKLPEKTKKVSLDSRFSRMFEDRRFSSSEAPVDKRGRLKESNENPLHHYYTFKEEERKEGSVDEDAGEGRGSGKRRHVKLSEQSSSDSLSGTETESSASEEEASTGTDTDTDTGSDEESEVDEDDGALVQEENVPKIDRETHRLAVVNMDWNHVKAEDIYVLLSSFLPKGGQIMSVAVYPSDFGLQRMEEEAVHGPIGLFEEDGQSSDGEDDELDDEKLRAYERSKLRYYYAVVECDSVGTADYLYKYCDGVEFERSSLVLDLRFIPDSMEFKHPPRDVATEPPASYEISDFYTAALQQTKVHLSWDEDEPNRAKTLKRKFNDCQLADMELKEYLASSETDDDESENIVEDPSEKKVKKLGMYRALVNGGSDGEPDDADQDMEVTFNTDLEDLSKRILEKKDKKSETVWEAYLRKRKEKKKSRKNRSKDSSEDESSDSDGDAVKEHDDFFVDEPALKRSKEAQGNNSKRKEMLHQEAEASKAELELLLADDKGTDTGLKGYNLKPKRLKGKNGKEVPDAAKLPNFNLDDPRFSALFTSPEFALDPTDPQFKRCAAVAPLIEQKQQRKIMRGEDGLPTEQHHETKREESVNLDESKKAQYELSSLVKSVKMKSQQARLPTSKSSKKKSQSIQF